RKLGKGDHLVKLKTSPQARKKWPGLGNEVTARLLTVTRKGKVEPPRVSWRVFYL
ncbi:hypothetical protein JS527_25150, partial [Shigella boydii]|nr:hypothetical protein [Shigella boydii]MBM6565899.1 hypothetical protein [Shigella boydii]MBM6574688.1 hypothetical protein [Shigella boydii]